MERLVSVDIPIDSPNFLVYHFYHKDLFASLEKYANGELLDIGCGNKPYRSIVETKVTKYTGCDIVQSSDNCVDIICEANHIPLATESFDTVLSTQTIEHVEDHQGLVNEAFRLLKPGGYFILAGPMYWPLHEEPYDFFRFTKYGFKYLLEKAGFTVLETLSNGGKWALCGQVLLHTLYPEVRKGKTFKYKFLRIGIRMIGGIKSINKFFLKMDKAHRNEVSTINYVVVAKKELI